MAQTKIHIGTCGWHYEHWEGPFYPHGRPSEDWLGYYAQQLSTVEINNSFYQLPEAETLDQWRQETPPDFLFSVKASRYITHMKKLKEAQEPVTNFLERVARLGEKLGPILFQLPPHWHFNGERLGTFLASLPGEYRYAFELRDDSWFNEQACDLLRQYSAAFCIHDLAEQPSPKVVTADFVYVRLHGPSAAYTGKYPIQTLAGWAGAFSAWRRQDKAIYCYFNNDMAGYAVENALALQAMFASQA